jgi:hypothetical protein
MKIKRLIESVLFSLCLSLFFWGGGGSVWTQVLELYLQLHPVTKQQEQYQDVKFNALSMN